MKKPDEIMKGLECCSDANNVCTDYGCAYENGFRYPKCREKLMGDAFAYIQQLEQDLAAVKRERDALSKDLKAACKLLWSDDSMHCCKFCEHENEPKDTGYCDKCANGNRFKFKPAALCPDNMEVQDDE